MNLIERVDLVGLTAEDLKLIRKIISKRKFGLLICIFIFLILFWLANTEKFSWRFLIFEKPFVAFFWFLIFAAILTLLYSTSLKPLLKDYKNGNKIKLQTQIQDYKRDRYGIKIKISNSAYTGKWLSIDQDDLKVEYNDWVLISMLPKSKVIYKSKRIDT